MKVSKENKYCKLLSRRLSFYPKIILWTTVFLLGSSIFNSHILKIFRAVSYQWHQNNLLNLKLKTISELSKAFAAILIITFASSIIFSNLRSINRQKYFTKNGLWELSQKTSRLLIHKLTLIDFWNLRKKQSYLILKRSLTFIQKTTISARKQPKW